MLTFILIDSVREDDDFIQSINMIHCNEQVHLYLLDNGDIRCSFCYKQIQNPNPQKYTCCSISELTNDNNCLVSKPCGSVNGYKAVKEFINFYENRYRIKRKSVYHRKYHIMNVMNDIAQTNGIQIGYYNREKILRIFQLIDNVAHQPCVCRKRFISINFIIKQLFDMLGIEYKFIPITKSKKTLNY